MEAIKFTLDRNNLTLDGIDFTCDANDSTRDANDFTHGRIDFTCDAIHPSLIGIPPTAPVYDAPALAVAAH